MEFLKIVSDDDPASRQIILKAYMGTDKGFFMAGYMVGMLADAIMLGVILHQFTHWWEYARKDDKPVVRYIVYFSMIFSIGLTIYMMIWIFHMFVYGFGKYTVFIEVSWLSWWFLADVVVRIPVQGFFAERAWALTNRSRWYGALLVALYAGAIGSGIAVKIYLPQLDRTDLSRDLLLTWISLEIASDIVVTATIAYKLCVARTGFTHTDALLTRLLKVVLETQLPPTILAVMFLVVFLTETLGSGTRAFVCAPKGYVICLLAVLNSRQSLRRDMSDESSFMKNAMNRRRNQPQLESRPSVSTEVFTYSEGERSPADNKMRRLLNRDIELSVDFSTPRNPLDSVNEEGEKDEDDLGGEVHEMKYQI